MTPVTTQNLCVGCGTITRVFVVPVLLSCTTLSATRVVEGLIKTQQQVVRGVCSLLGVFREHRLSHGYFYC